MLPVLIGIEGLSLSAEEESLISRYQPAGFVLFSRNFHSLEQARALTDSLRRLCRHHPIIAMDQEGGRVVRTASMGLLLPSPASLVAKGEMKAVTELGLVTAAALRCLGVNMNFAPVLDISYDPSVANALSGRCWGNNAQDVISHAYVYASALRRGGVLSCGKHFPGMGRALADPHLKLPVIDAPEDVLFRTDLQPFLALSSDLPAVMSAHVMMPKWDPVFPATLSSAIMQKLLRDRLGFKGVVFTDDLCMGAMTDQFTPAQAALLALRAGCDLPLICHDPLPWLEPIASQLDEWDLYDRDDSFKRVENFCDSICSPLPNHHTVWMDCLRRADLLCHSVDDLPSDPSPISPVQNY